jgi:lysophospholipase L1-like esterase
MCQPNGGGIYVTFDLVNKVISIHSSWDGTITTVPNVLVTGNINLTFVANREYILEIKKDTAKTLTATVYDAITTASSSITDTTTGDDHMHGDGRYLGLLHKAGTYTRNRFYAYTSQKTQPRLYMIGDSYIVGYNLIRYGFDIKYRYAQLVSDALNGDVSISAKGGEYSSGLVEKIYSDFQIIKPKYTLLAIGINDVILSAVTFDQYKVNMSRLINAIRNSGSIPILTTYPRLSDGVDSQNSWVRNYSGCKYVDIQLATSVDGTITGTPDNGLFLADGHPNIAGNQRIFDKFKLDCPYVFSD